VEAGVITVTTLDRVLRLQKGNSKRLGALLRDLGIVSEEEVVEALARQCQLRTVRNFAGQPFPKSLLNLVPPRLALKKLIFPLKQYEGMLAIATADPFDSATFACLAQRTGMRIYPVLACGRDIALAIEKHYRLGRWTKNGRPSILLMDPSPLITRFLQEPLTEEGYQLLTANDGVDGLRLAFSHCPDLIICDASMPRLDGYSFLRIVKAHRDTADIPVILMASKSSAEQEYRALEAGFADVIGKPTLPHRVIAKIEMVFSLPANGRQPLPHAENS